MRLGQAVAQRFRQRRRAAGRIVIGKDTRLSGYMLESALQAGIVSAGADVHAGGAAADARDRVHHLVDARRRGRGDQRVAQPLPGQRHQDLRRGRVQAARRGRGRDRARAWRRSRAATTARAPAPDAIGKAVRIDDAVGRYVQFLKHAFPKELTLDGMKVVVDCANGAAYHVAPQVFQELGAEVVASSTSGPTGATSTSGAARCTPERMAEEVRLSRAPARHGAGRRRRPRDPRRREGQHHRRGSGHGDPGDAHARAAGSCRGKPWCRR